MEDQMFDRDPILHRVSQATPYVKHQVQLATPLHRWETAHLLQRSTTVKYIASQIALQEPTAAPFCAKIGGSTTSIIIHIHE